MSDDAPKPALFLTWYLWSAVRYPRRQHPIFRYGLRQHLKHRTNTQDWRGVQIMIGVIAVLFAVLFPIPTLVMVLGGLISLPVWILLLNGTILGLIWMLAVSQTIGNLHTKQQYDLMQLSPIGALGVAWILATGIVHRDGLHRQSYRIIVWVVRTTLILLGIACIIMLIVIASTSRDNHYHAQVHFISDILQLCLWAMVIWLDHVQSILIALLLGIVAPTYLRETLSRRALLILTFISVQILTYLLALVIYQVTRTITLSMLGSVGVAPLLITGIAVFSLFALRETIMSILWHIIRIRYDDAISTHDLNMMNAG